MNSKSRNRRSVSRNLRKLSSRKDETNFIGQVFTKGICLLLIFNFLTLSVPAAPPVIKNVIGETYQDIRFGFYSGGWGIDLPSVLGFFSRSGTADEEAEPVSRVKIYPGSLTVRENNLVVLSAVAFNADDEPLSGLAFDWTMTDSEGGSEPRSLPAGHFRSRIFVRLSVSLRRRFTAIAIQKLIIGRTKNKRRKVQY